MFRTRRTRFIPLLFILFSNFVLIQGCTGLSNPALTVQERVPASSTFGNMAEQTLLTLYPDRFNALHRTTLSVGGHTLVMKGFLSIDRQKRQIKLISQAEMGGKLFEIHLNDEKVDIIYASTALKKEWLERFVAVDLKQIYLTPVLGNPVHFSKPGNRFVLVNQVDDNLIQEYLFSPEKSPTLRYNSFRILKNNRSVYFMDMSYGENSPYPEFITIENRANKYRLDINVRYMM